MFEETCARGHQRAVPT